jgi:galactosylceramidase
MGKYCSSFALLRRQLALVIAFWLLNSAPLTIAKATSSLTNSNIILVDGTKGGRTFEGVGAIGQYVSLLFDYPEPQRSEILDFLFKPDYGASLQILKVEVGGDINSTDGSEPSHMHTRNDENYTRGYEWWLMEEARKRNPNIVLECLAWGAPAWIGNGKFYSQDMADYLVKFIQGAKRVHNLDMNFVGIWNECNNLGFSCNRAWIKLLRRTLDQNKLQKVGIVAPDQMGNWDIIDDMNRDPDLKAAIAAVGVHYPKCASPPAAQTCGVPLWASEDGPWSGRWNANSDLTIGSLPEILNRNYIGGRIVKTEIWIMLTSYYDNLPLPGSGLMLANTPWSGHYEVQPAIWAVAHTTQFAKPGWTYMDSACRMLDGGSVVALKSPWTNDFSIIIETMSAKHALALTFQITGNLSDSPLHVWYSDSTMQFIEMKDLSPKMGKFTINVEPDSVYSLTTSTGQHRGTVPAPPPDTPFPFPYHEDFESYDVGQSPRYVNQRNGVFEIVKRADGHGNALHLASHTRGIEWVKMKDPQMFLGSLDWKDYSVCADFLLDTPGNVALYGRIGSILENDTPAAGYCLEVNYSGDWELQAGAKVIGAGKVPFSRGIWHQLRLKFKGDSIDVVVDKATVALVKDETFKAGMVGLGCGWHEAQFDNIVVQ